MPRTLKRSSIELELNRLHRPSSPIALQRIEQRFGILQVCGVKALNEPAIDRDQQLVRCHGLILLLSEPTQSHRRPQLERWGLLPASDAEGLVKALRNRSP